MTQKDHSEDLSFDEMELHGDVTIRKQAPSQNKPPRRRSGPSGFGGLTWFLILLLVGTAMGLWYFYGQLQALQARYDELANDKESTSHSLHSAATSLEEANSRLSRLEPELGKAQEEIKALTGKNKDQEKKIADLNGDLKKTSKEAADRKAELEKTRQQVDRLTAEGKQLRDDRTRIEKEAAASIEDLNARLQAQTTLYNSSQQEREQERADLQSKLRKSDSELAKLRKSFEDEAQASMQILKNQAQLEASKKQLEKKVADLEASLKTSREKVARLENVDFGDLVPYSDELVPAQPNFMEPLPDGVKVPRKLGAVALQVLINEKGVVEKAFIQPGQTIEAELAKALTQSIYQWKFSPPELNRVRVKTWQTVLVRAE